MSNGESNASEIWQAVIGHIRARSENVFNQWFKKMVPISADEKQIVIGTSDHFLASFVTDNYGDVLADALAAAGYARYEISNFARPDRHSRHNLRYWQGRPYLGLGLAAHSDFEGRRFAAGRDMDAYLQGDWISESEEMDAEERRAEFIMLRLRLEEGISTEEYRQRFGRDFYAEFDGVLAPYRRAGLLREEGGRVALTTEGMLLSNTVLAELLMQVQ